MGISVRPIDDRIGVKNHHATVRAKRTQAATIIHMIFPSKTVSRNGEADSVSQSLLFPTWRGQLISFPPFRLGFRLSSLLDVSYYGIKIWPSVGCDEDIKLLKAYDIASRSYL